MRVTQVTELRHVVAGAACTGCLSCQSACSGGAIELVSDAEGFWYPDVDSSACTECGQCVRACPLTDTARGQASPTAFACQSADEAVRMGSSSGGVFTLLAEMTLEDGGIVFGAALGSGLEVAHVGVEEQEGIQRLRGSKYVQSDTRGLFGAVALALDEGRPVLFSGTPCQVAALRAYLGGSPDDLTCVDFFCHGVPSPQVWRQYVLFQERRFGSRADAASFRDKRWGWRQFSMFMHFENGATYRQTHDRDPYLRAYLADICLRPSCHKCNFKGLSRMSDVTLADFWGIEHVLPTMDDDSGTSLVLVNSGVGSTAFSRVLPYLECEQVPLELAVTTNTAAVQSVAPHPARQAFFRDLNTVRFDRLVRRYVYRSLIQRVWNRLACSLRLRSPVR